MASLEPGERYVYGIAGTGSTFSFSTYVYDVNNMPQYHTGWIDSSGTRHYVADPLGGQQNHFLSAIDASGSGVLNTALPGGTINGTLPLRAFRFLNGDVNGAFELPQAFVDANDISDGSYTLHVRDSTSDGFFAGQVAKCGFGGKAVIWQERNPIYYNSEPGLSTIFESIVSHQANGNVSEITAGGLQHTTGAGQVADPIVMKLGEPIVNLRSVTPAAFSGRTARVHSVLPQGNTLLALGTELTTIEGVPLLVGGTIRYRKIAGNWVGSTVPKPPGMNSCSVMSQEGPVALMYCSNVLTNANGAYLYYAVRNLIVPIENITNLPAGASFLPTKLTSATELLGQVRIGQGAEQIEVPGSVRISR